MIGMGIIVQPRLGGTRVFVRYRTPHFAIRTCHGWLRAVPSELAQHDCPMLGISDGAVVKDSPGWLGYRPVRVICFTITGKYVPLQEVRPERVVPLSWFAKEWSVRDVPVAEPKPAPAEPVRSRNATGKMPNDAYFGERRAGSSIIRPASPMKPFRYGR